MSPTRGAQGNALKTLVAMPFVLHGERGRVEIETGGRRHVIDFRVDRIRQEPVVSLTPETSDVKKGTVVRLLWPESACSNLADAETQFLQIASDYAWLNPHLSLTVQWFGETVTAATATDPAWAKWKPSDPTSPHWYTAEHLERLLAAYIAVDRPSTEARGKPERGTFVRTARLLRRSPFCSTGASSLTRSPATLWSP